MVYILHFDRPYKHARHYVGYTETADSLRERLDRHLEGKGARLLEVVTAEGIGFTLADIIEGDRHAERRIKKAGHTARICSICKRERNA
jgi:predicted GIY-YIG superfamily endonuclease